MKNILLSIDFSKHAYNAALYAAELASHTGARLILFHAYNPVVLTEDEELGEELINSERKVQDKLDSLARKLQSLTDISITRLLKPGNVVDETLYVATKIKTDLIIIGLQDTTSQHHPALDAVTSEILERSSMPVLLVPPKAVFRSYEHVYLASEGPGAVHDLVNLKFLNKLFYRFRGVEVVKYGGAKIESGAQATKEVNKSADQVLMPAAEQQINDNYINGLQGFTEPVQAQLWIYTYPSVADFENNVNTCSLKFAEAIPVLLLPVG